MKWLLRVWLYGVPTAGLTLGCLIVWFSPVDRWLIYTAYALIIPTIIYANIRARKLERKHGFDAFLDRLNLVIFCVLAALLLFSMIVAFKGNLSKMNGMVAMIGITCGIPLSGCRAFSKQRNTVA